MEYSDAFSHSRPDVNGEMDDLLRCFICYGRVQDAHLCPSCSKMCCKECIVRWLSETKPACPHCRSGLHIDQLVNCRFVQDLTKVVDRFRNNVKCREQICSLHQCELLYYCIDCSEPICADCAMFSSNHIEHVFEKLSLVHQRHVQQLVDEITQIQDRLRLLRAAEGSVEKNIAAVKESKNFSCDELGRLSEQIETSILTQFKAKNALLLKQMNEILEEIELLENMVEELKRYSDPAKFPKSELIQKSAELLCMTRHVYEKPISYFTSMETVSDKFVSEILPEYVGSEFNINQFLEARSRDEVVYSPPLKVNGMSWRLKVYPNGNGAARDSFLSVFLELTDGFHGSDIYEYQVQLVNHRQLDKTIDRTFSSRFESGESWGYNRFLRIDVITSDGFLSGDGTLTMKFFVRPPSFVAANAMQQRYIDYLERTVAINRKVIKDLEKAPFRSCRSTASEIGSDGGSIESDVDDTSAACEAELTQSGEDHPEYESSSCCEGEVDVDDDEDPLNLIPNCNSNCGSNVSTLCALEGAHSHHQPSVGTTLSQFTSAPDPLPRLIIAHAPPDHVPVNAASSFKPEINQEIDSLESPFYSLALEQEKTSEW